MGETSTRVTLSVDLVGLERVNTGFREIGASALSMGRDVQASNSLIGGGFDVMAGKVAYSSSSVTTWAGTSENAFGRAAAAQERYRLGSEQAELSSKRLMLTTAGLIGNSVQLGDIIDRIAKGQMDLGRGALMLGMNFLQLASQIWVVVGAENARAIAHSVANAVSGPRGWAILAGAAAAAAVGIGLAGQIPRAAEGAVIDRPTLLLAGEAGKEWYVPDSKVMPLSSYLAPNTTSNVRSVYARITIVEARDPAATARAVKAALEEVERDDVMDRFRSARVA